MTITHPWLRLMRLDRPIGTWLLMWPALWALWFAGDGHPAISNLLIFTVGVVVMRAAGCIINDYADRHVDGGVQRTSGRPMVTGEVSESTALKLFFTLMAAAFVLVLMTNKMTVMLSFGGAALAACYPFMKRFTHLPQFVLGACWAWSVPMIFAAQQQQLPIQLWWLFAGTFFWCVAFDTYYAMVDREDDLHMGIKSTAVLFGRYDLMLIVLFQALSLCCLAIAGWQFGRGMAYFVGLLAAAGLFVHQYWVSRGRDRDACFRAFLNNHRVGMIIFIALGLDYLL